MQQFKELLNNFKEYNVNFVDDYLESKIIETLNQMFPQLIKEDRNILIILVRYIVDIISMKYGFNKNDLKYYKQWTQNNCRDIKGVLLLLLPYIDDKMNGYLLKKMVDLNQFLYAYRKENIPTSLLKETKDDIISSHFEFGNMGIGLLEESKDKENLLNLYENNEKKIYEIIYNNMIGLLKTLEIMNGKYYINWINIVPLNLNNYKDSHIYKKTVEYYSLIQKSTTESNVKLLLNNSIFQNYGLWLGEFYNILRCKFYEETKQIKWLVFPYEFIDDKNIMRQIYLIHGLNMMYDVDSIIASDIYNMIDLDDNEQREFKNKSDEVYIRLVSNTSYTGLMNVDFEIIKYFLINMINNISELNNMNNIILNRFKLRNMKEEQQDDYDKKSMEKINKLTIQDIIDCYKFINTNYMHHIWNYIKDSVEILKTSVFGHNIIINNKLTNTYYYKETQLNFKNIYNIAKSLSHATNVNNEWVLLDKNFISFDEDNQSRFFYRIFNKSKIDWINLSGNFKRQYVNIKIPNNHLATLLNDFTIILVDLIFEELVKSGVLNSFEVNLEITDKSLLPSNFNLRRAKIRDTMKKKFKEKKKEYGESYYYLTNCQFKDMQKIRFEKKNSLPNDKYEELTYFELITKDHDWPNFYAMDWISQISFFQHYIYHQVMYVTGATGQGKSTQVPKLLLYALKAIDYKTNGKVICTQPRITPTVDNATRIAEELGVPIQGLSNRFSIPIKTDNTYVQFKHQQEAHTSNINSQPYLRIVTDGTLFEELLQNTTLKSKKNIDGNDIITNNNIYDIVIVDEAHEHNVYMDLIITLTKQACYFNNMVRLIIVSATMDDDEPIYRRYFNTINDNLLFPIKYPLNLPNIGTFLPNPMYMDRRYHISPPGETTQYRVDEIYLEEDITKYDDDNKKCAKKAQELGYEKIIEICNKTTTGEILFFANGMKEIDEAVIYLNKVLPPGNITLPFYSELNDQYKNIVTKIDSMIYKIKNKRENIASEWGPTFIEDITVPDGSYKRAIIIATNVAEASITLSSLKYVIDNGYAKVNKFDDTIGIESLEIEQISEASRIQRKGRVGRVGDGIVYYMYKKGTKEKIKPNYKITMIDMVPSIVKLMCSKPIDQFNIKDGANDEQLIVKPQFSPNHYSFMEKYNDISGADNYTIKSGLFNIFLSNYLINNGLLPTIYYKSRNTVLPTDYSVFNVFHSGQIIENILDITGQFYLIHPFELKIKRNILNRIIKCNNKEMTFIERDNYRIMIAKLLDMNLFIDANGEDLFNSPNEMNNMNRKFILTEIAQQYKILSRDFMITVPETITMIAASAMSCFHEVMRLMIFIRKLAPFYSMTSIISPNIKWEEYKKKFLDPNIKSDLIYIHNILESLHKHFKHLLVFNINSTQFQSILQQNLNNKLAQFRNTISNKKEPPIDFSPSLWNKLLNLKKNGKLNEDSMKVFKSDSYVKNIIYTDLYNNMDSIKTWCNTYYLNFDYIMKYIEEYIEYFLKKNITEDNIVIMWAKNFSSNFNKYLTHNTIEERIIRSFLYGNPSQYTFSIHDNGKYNYRTYINRAIYPVLFSRPLIKGESETITNLSNEMTFYLHYAEVKLEDMYTEESKILNLRLLSQIDPTWLIPALPQLANPLYTHDIIITKGIVENKSVINYLNTSAIDIFKIAITNNWNKSYIIWDSEYSPILRYFYKLINKTISKRLLY
jgi:hypothetical protein